MTNETKNLWVFLTCIVVLLSLFIWGLISLKESIHQEDKERRESGYHLPWDATNIVDVGDYWQEFTYKGQRFLFYRHNLTDEGYGAIVKIDMPKVEND